jgi:hypothetical protein
VAKAKARSLYRQESAPVTVVQEGGWVPGPVRTGERHLAPTRIESRDFPALSESLYRLHYPGPLFRYKIRYLRNEERCREFYALRHEERQLPSCLSLPNSVDKRGLRCSSPVNSIKLRLTTNRAVSILHLYAFVAGTGTN